jgi:hypothetical protein
MALLLLVSSLAIADIPEIKVPPLAPPEGLQVSIPKVPWWNSAEKARVAACSPFSLRGEPLGKPVPLLLPYPYQAPPNARAYFFFQ